LKGRCILFGFGQDIGIDLGTATVLVYIKGKGIVLREPSVVAIDKNTNRLLAVGEDARKMLGRTPGNIVAIRPLRDGVISDYDITERMLKYFIKKVCGYRIFKPRIIICVPSGVTEVEERAVIDAAMQAGARKTFLIEEPIAAAIGAGIDISKACGSMVVDIGGGTTDIAVISLGGTVVSTSIKVAGDKFDEAIVRYMRKKHNIMIGERTAEEMKINIGSAYPREQEITMDVRGRNLISGLPRTITVTSSEMMEALEESVASIVEAVHGVLEKTPPELVADISDRGIVLTGGGSLIYGLDKLLQEKTGINVIIADDAISCVALGTGKALDNIEVLRERGKR
jgi:rod shape-determining protein MreB